jgi:hypothetical protein
MAPLVIEYDAKLMIIFYVLNPIVQESIAQVDGSYVGVVEEKDNIFGVGASIEESSCALVVGELSLLRRFSVVLTTCVDPFAS